MPLESGGGAPLRPDAAADPSSPPGVSFVVTVYNKRDYLPAVVEGLLRQCGDFPREFIFVDDGSSDGSTDQIARLIARLPHARLVTQPNRGPSVATNRGLGLARYPLVKLVDGDDVLLPDATARLRDALLRHPEAVLAAGDAEGYDTPDEALARVRAAPGGEAGGEAVVDALPALLRNCFLAPSRCLLRTGAARAAGGCDERVFTQDYSLFLRLAARGRFVLVGGITALGPRRAPGRVNDGGPQVLYDINLTLLHFLGEHAVPRVLVRRSVRRAVKRAWYWARRRETGGVFAASSWLLVAAYLRGAGASPALLRRSCEVFAARRSVRRMPSALR